MLSLEEGTVLVALFYQNQRNVVFPKGGSTPPSSVATCILSASGFSSVFRNDRAQGCYGERLITSITKILFAESLADLKFTDDDFCTSPGLLNRSLVFSLYMYHLCDINVKSL